MTLNAQISLKPGRYAQPPNTILVPRDRKTFPVEVLWHIETDQTRIVAASHTDATHAWCVLDEGLRPAGGGGKSAAKKRKGVHPHVSQTVQGGGAHNPNEMAVELESAKLKDGRSYTLVCKFHGLMAATDFVAVAPAAGKKARKKKAAKKKKKKKTARKYKARKKKKAAAKKKTVRKSAARKKKKTRKAAAKKKTVKKRKTVKKAAAKKRTARKKPAKKRKKRKTRR